MNRQAIELLSLGHFLINFRQGVVPALLPYLVVDRDFFYTAAAGLAVSVGGMCASFLGRLATGYGLVFVFSVLLAMLLVATAQAFALPPVPSGERLEPQLATMPVTADLSE